MIKVAAYCRVSTDSSDQANSFESQQRYFREYIERNPDWELTEIYADKGLSGTNTKKRVAFQKMINDAELGKFSLILTKEVSRFARNTVDTLNYARLLKAQNIGIYFMVDNIRTLDPDAEFRLTIMASIAQEESRKTSERVKWGQKRRMEQGVVFGRDMLGYDVIDGKMYINEKGAEIVRLIFHKFVEEKKGTYTIARELREAGYKTIRGNVMWTNTVILKAIRNEKYCGDLIQKKTYTPDFLTHQKKYNKGQEDFVTMKDHHEPIISRELWQRAQEELERRSPSQEIKNKHSNRYPLSGKIFCGCCGGHFVSRTKKRKDGSRYKAWRCYEAAQFGTKKLDSAGNEIGCEVNSQIRDEDFMLAISECVKRLVFDKNKIIDNLCNIIEIVLSNDERLMIDTDEIKKRMTVFQNKIDRLLDLYTSGDLSKEEYRNKKAEYEAEISELENSLEAFEKGCDISYDKKQLIKSLKAKIKATVTGAEQDETFYKNILDKIIVHDRENIDIFFNLLPYEVTSALKSARERADAYGSILNTKSLYR
ncbi:recombinase family protein [Ructibacterium gallinarum]|uniref:Recombinase family protein n=1 Tax=Ructibacterium gallinarum TaxID=2779355 RepID=A0A9D5R927_9FIRM|nr:recombinase family protein [Ructibacterium gallinarum]MBE5040587.1 recombinase family protein [Ructibacterium gallinarum]